MDLLFGVIGGDRRQAELLKLLRQDGYQAAAYGAAGEMDWERGRVGGGGVLPLPLCREGDTINIEGSSGASVALLRQMRRNQLLLAGEGKAGSGGGGGRAGPEPHRLFQAGGTDSCQRRRHGGGDSSGDFGAFGALAAGEPLSGTGLWAYRQAAVSPPERYGGKCHGGGQTPGVSGLGRGLWL